MPPPNLGVMPSQIPTSISGGLPLANTTNASSRDRSDVDQVLFLCYAYCVLRFGTIIFENIAMKKSDL